MGSAHTFGNVADTPDPNEVSGNVEETVFDTGMVLPRLKEGGATAASKVDVDDVTEDEGAMPTATSD